MSLIVVDYGMGNLGSVKRSFEEAGATVLLSQNPDDLKHAAKIVLPGVGAFPDGMKALKDAGWDIALKEAVIQNGKPILGICLGMQLLASIGNEGEITEGLAFIEGSVNKLTPIDTETRIPHVGWNEVNPLGDSDIFYGIEPMTDYYFVHSYHFIPKNLRNIIAKTPYCGEFVSAVAEANIFGVQFHPEKSSKAGLKLIKNFLDI